MLWLLYPFLMAFVIIVTANHFIFDALLGAVTAGVSAYGASWLARARPHAWRFSPRPPARRQRRAARRSQRWLPRQHAPAPRAARRAPARRRARARAPIGAGERRELVRNRLIESRLTPNAISLTGFALNLVAAVLVWERLFFLGGIAFIVGSIMDTLDGRYSRMSGKGTPFGAFLDSTLDRIEEGIVLTAVAGYFALQGNRVAAAAVVVAVLASLMVSYTRARAEALGVECKVGHRHAARCAS